MVFLQTQSVVNLTTEFQGRTTTPAPTDAAAVSGVETNGAGDLMTFLTGLMRGKSASRTAFVGFTIMIKSLNMPYDE